MRYKLLTILALTTVGAWAEAPTGYYSACEGKSGKALLEALEDAISNHINVGYNGLWDLYEETDVYPDGKIWDMYSTKHWNPVHERCGSYSSVGDCYNREHSFPKSWFDGGQPMSSDAFHIYPTDGKVNGQRSNYPYGECANGSTLASSGGVKALGKLGKSTFEGYSGTVFEPDDEYKGDLARSYFYMAACYNRLIDDWNSDMLAGNSYPAFTPWALKLLLKWHRQDPVSTKELNRNEAVYMHQHNRNPFIDHPELVEYVWGDMVGRNWSAQGETPAALLLPVDGSKIDLGFLAVNGKKTQKIAVKGNNLTSDVTISSTSPYITADVAKIAAVEANKPDGYAVTICWNPKEAGVQTSTITFASGSLCSVVTVNGTAMEGLIAHVPEEITDRSFVASWDYAGDEYADGTYRICYAEAGDLEKAAYVSAKATAERCEIDGLKANTPYSYWVESANNKSNVVTLSTTDPIPYIDLLYPGDLYLNATPGEPSEAYEVLIDADNIDSDITISVSEPFQLSSDKDCWGTKLTVMAEEDRFYIRLYSDCTGTYSTIIKIEAGDYVNDNIEILGAVADTGSFYEDFEADNTGCDTYGGCEYVGSAATWYFFDAGIWEADHNDAHNGKQCLRLGKKSSSYIEMLGNKGRGIGTVSLYAKRWTAKDGNATFHIEYSTDNGSTWQSTSDAVVTADEYSQFTFSINVPGETRIRLQQTEGARFIIDDLELSDYTSSHIEGVDSDYLSWDAFCLRGELVIECAIQQQALVYGVDGIVRYDGTVGAGRTSLQLPKGLYIVAIDDFARRVMVK